MRGRRKTLQDTKEQLKAEHETPAEDMMESDADEKAEQLEVPKPKPKAKGRRGKMLAKFKKKQVDQAEYSGDLKD